jgi:hypothetical protein
MDSIVDARRDDLTPVLTEDVDRAWWGVGRVTGYIAGIGVLVMTVLFMLDELDVLDRSPGYVRTSAGALRDEAAFWAAVFAHQHRVLWDVIVRDVVGSAAFVALIVVGLAVRRRTASDRPEAQLMVAMLSIGAGLSIVANLLYLGNVEFWRVAGWTGGEAPVSMVAVGRATTAINNLTTWPEAFGYLALAGGILCLGLVARGGGTALPARLGTLAYVTAAALTGLSVAELTWSDVPRQVLSLAVGVVLAPWLCLWLARRLGEPSEPSRP